MDDKVKELIRDKKAELFDLQLMVGTLQTQMQAKMNELNSLIMDNKDK